MAMTSLKQAYCLHPIGLGAMPLSITGRPSENEAIDIIAEFLALGGNFIDTANVYSLDDSERGHNEILIHKALKKLNRHQDVLVATKGGASRPAGGWGLGEGHPRQLRAACEQSLLNLQRSEHALYYLHGPDPRFPLEDSLGELTRLKEEGKIKHLGIANVSIEQLQFAMKHTELSAVQNRCNPFCKGDIKNPIIDLCKSHNMLYVPYCPLGGWADHTRLSTHPSYLQLTEKYQISPYQVSLAWLLSKGDHIIPIPGIDKKEQIALNFTSMEVSLSEKDITEINTFPDLYLPYHQEQT